MVTVEKGAHEHTVSYETGIVCLIQLKMLQFEKAPNNRPKDGKATLTHLVNFASAMGIQARHIRLEWSSMLMAMSSSPLLLLLKNANVVIVVGPGPAEEVAVWDPLSRADGILFVPRTALEEAWDGDALVIENRQEEGLILTFQKVKQAAYKTMMLLLGYCGCVVAGKAKLNLRGRWSEKRGARRIISDRRGVERRISSVAWAGAERRSGIDRRQASRRAQNSSARLSALGAT